MIGAVTRYNHEGLHVTGTELTFTGLEHTETNQVVNPYSNCTIMYNVFIHHNMESYFFLNS